MRESIDSLLFLKIDLKRYSDNKVLKKLFLLIPLIYIKTWPVIAYRVCRFLLLLPWPFSRILTPVRIIFRWLSQMITKSEISEYADLGPGLFIAHLGPVVVGRHVKAGRNLFLRQNITLGGNGKDHGHPTLGHNVIIGANSVVIGPISIGSDTIIGAMSLVNKSCGENSVLVGIPAKNIKGGH